MALFGSLSTVRAQAPRTPAFDAAWAYIDALVRDGSPESRRLAVLGAGASEKHELAHGVFAIEQAYLTKPRAEGFFESHRKYIDIQVIVAGEEIMEVVDLSRTAERDSYVEARDLLVLRDTPRASALRVHAGEAAVFFPEDVHMPSLRTGADAALVRKSVLKVPVKA